MQERGMQNGDGVRNGTDTHPPTAATSMSPRASFASSAVSGARRLAAAELAPAQKVATAVPTMHPEPVISPRSGWPFERRTTVVPSDM